MNPSAESLSPSIRGLEERADRDLAMLDRMRPSTLSAAIRQVGSVKAPTPARQHPAPAEMYRDKVRAADSARAKSAGDNGDDGDTAPHKALSRPPLADVSGDAGSDSAPTPHFLLLERGDGRQSPGVYWCDVTRDAHGEVMGQAAPVWICSPLRVAGMTRDAQGGEWGRLLVFPGRGTVGASESDAVELVSNACRSQCTAA
jgi:hypothetical protein